MKKLTPILVFCTILLTTQLGAQEFTGLATYKTAMKMDISIDSTQMSADQQSLVQRQLMKAMQKEYELSFNASESNWKELKELDKEQEQPGVRVVMVGIGGGEDGLLYKNTKDKNYKETTEAFGKLFLVSGELEPYEWEMTQETKQIGEYTCYKAIAEREVSEMRVSDINGKKEEKEIKRTEKTTVWYTPDIPVAHGPDNYWGLPGLILEASNGRRTILCSKIVLNPKEKVSIELPHKGKEVTAEEYEKIMQEQSIKMNRMNRGGKKKGEHGNSIRISVNG